MQALLFLDTLYKDPKENDKHMRTIFKIRFIFSTLLLGLLFSNCYLNPWLQKQLNTAPSQNENTQEQNTLLAAVALLPSPVVTTTNLSLLFPSSDIILILGNYIEITPVATSSILNCTVDPSLPTGLTLTSNCQIQGTPSVPSLKTSYTITASNGSETISVSIFISVNSATPKGLASLSGLTLNPSFSNSVLEYTATVNLNQTQLPIIVTTTNSTATMELYTQSDPDNKTTLSSGVGYWWYFPQGQVTVYRIDVTETDGTVTTYQFSVTNTN